MGDEGASDRDDNPPVAPPRRRARRQPTLMGFAVEKPGVIQPPGAIQPPADAEPPADSEGSGSESAQASRTKSGTQPKAPARPVKRKAFQAPGGAPPLPKPGGLPPRKQPSNPFGAPSLPKRPFPRSKPLSPKAPAPPAAEAAPPEPEAAPASAADRALGAAARWDSAPVPSEDSGVPTSVGPAPEPDAPAATAAESSTDVGLPPEPPATPVEPEVVEPSFEREAVVELEAAVEPSVEPEPIELEGEPTNVAVAAPLAAESTQVNAEAPVEEPEDLDDETKPAIELPHPADTLDELPYQQTMPRATQPERDGAGAEASSPIFYDAGQPATEPEPEELRVESTVVVDPAAMVKPAPTYSVDVESGKVQLTDEIPGSATHVVQRPTREGRLGLIVGVGLAAFVLVAVGFATVWFVYLAPGDTSDPIVDLGGDTDPTSGDPTSSDPTSGDSTSGDADPSDTDPAETDPAADPGAGDPADPGDVDGDPDVEDPDAEAEDPDADDPEADDPDDEAPTQATGAPASREEIDSYELARVPPNRRARRMTESERVRQCNRLKARGLAEYRREQWADAERLYREALGYNNWDVAAVEGMARSTARQGRFPEAIAWANLAVERNARSAATFRVLGDVWRQAGHPDEALRAWRRGVRRHPEDAHLRRRIREVRSE